MKIPKGPIIDSQRPCGFQGCYFGTGSIRRDRPPRQQATQAIVAFGPQSGSSPLSSGRQGDRMSLRIVVIHFITTWCLAYHNVVFGITSRWTEAARPFYILESFTRFCSVSLGKASFLVQTCSWDVSEICPMPNYMWERATSSPRYLAILSTFWRGGGRS